MSKAVKIVVVSDTHELHRELDVPDGDLLVHAGDFTMFSRSLAAIRDFNDWLGELPHRFKIVVPGNHESFLVADPAKRALLGNATVLINEAAEIMGLRIWGSPVTPLASGAFALPEEAARRSLYSQVSDDVDILITHGPPLGVLDRAPESTSGVGCPELLKAVHKTMPRLHVFGHVHGAYGSLVSGSTLYINAALLGMDGDLEHRPFAVRIPLIEKSKRRSTRPRGDRGLS